jgi:WD40 repeat protein
VLALDIIKDKDILISSSGDRIIYFWNMTTGTVIKNFTGHN